MVSHPGVGWGGAAAQTYSKKTTHPRAGSHMSEMKVLRGPGGDAGPHKAADRKRNMAIAHWAKKR